MEYSDWEHLPLGVIQALGTLLPAPERAQSRLVCKHWRNALAATFTELYLGPAALQPASQHSGQQQQQQQQQQGHASMVLPQQFLGSCFPAVGSVQLVTSSSREYPGDYAQEVAKLLAQLPQLTHLKVLELHEIHEVYDMEPASVWDALCLALPRIASRLRALHITNCFWHSMQPFGVLAGLTALTELRLRNVPLETAAEVELLAGMAQLRVLEFGVCYDGSSETHGVPAALASLGALVHLRELCIPLWRRSFGGQAHPLAPALSASLGQLGQLGRLEALEVDGRFGYLGVVSVLTSLTRLKSATPVTESGWRAISKLPNLRELGSLTPLWQEPSRPRQPAGGDLGGLACTSCLQVLDSFVPRAAALEHLGRFTALRSLSLRAHHLELPEQDVLRHLAHLPPSLTAFSSCLLVSISSVLLQTLAAACPNLRQLGLMGLPMLPDATADLAALSQLQTLKLEGHMPPGSRVQQECMDAWMLALAHLPPKLASLELKRCCIVERLECHGGGGRSTTAADWDVLLHNMAYRRATHMLAAFCDTHGAVGGGMGGGSGADDGAGMDDASTQTAAAAAAAAAAVAAAGGAPSDGLNSHSATGGAGAVAPGAAGCSIGAAGRASSASNAAAALAGLELAAFGRPDAAPVAGAAASHARDDAVPVAGAAGAHVAAPHAAAPHGVHDAGLTPGSPAAAPVAAPAAWHAGAGPAASGPRASGNHAVQRQGKRSGDFDAAGPGAGSGHSSSGSAAKRSRSFNSLAAGSAVQAVGAAAVPVVGLEDHNTGFLADQLLSALASAEAPAAAAAASSGNTQQAVNAVALPSSAAALPARQSLQLHHCHVTAPLPALQCLQLHNCRVTAAALSALGAAAGSHLTQLCLQHIRLIQTSGPPEHAAGTPDAAADATGDHGAAAVATAHTVAAARAPQQHMDAWLDTKLLTPLGAHDLAALQVHWPSIEVLQLPQEALSPPLSLLSPSFTALLPSLRTLRLSVENWLGVPNSPGANAAVVGALKMLPRLRRLEVAGSEKLALELQEALLLALPRCRLHMHPGNF